MKEREIEKPVKREKESSMEEWGNEEVKELI